MPEEEPGGFYNNLRQRYILVSSIDGDSIPELQRGTQAIKSGTEIRSCCRNLNGDRHGGKDTGAGGLELL
jgi:hypothetical protein